MENKRVFHPIVDRYVSSGESLRDIIAKDDSNNEEIVNALGLLQDFISGSQSANGAFLAAKNVILRDIDTDLCVLFLTSWANAVFIQSQHIKDRLEESWTLLHRAKALISPETPSEIIAYLYTVEGMLVGSRGDRTRQEAIIKGALKQLHKNSPRFGAFMLHMADFMAKSGRLEEVATSLNRISKKNGSQSDINIARFINLVETGRNDQADRLIKEIQSTTEDPIMTKKTSRHKLLLQLMRSPSRPVAGDENNIVPQPDMPDWALVIQSLLSNHIHQALRWARICEKNNQSFNTGQEFMSFNLVRAELAEGNADAARRLMEMRLACGNISYMDFFFNARIELLSGNMDAAVRCFAQLLQNLDRYNASGRAAFELRLAPELSSEMVFKLTRSAESISKPKKTTPAKTPLAPQPQPTAGDDATGVDRIIGVSSAISSVRETILQLSDNDVPVLISGETGTGKELVARALHEAGARKDKPFVAINCGAISESLLESELFGHEKGAFSGASTSHQGLFEEAADGTILLDEIGEITPRLQVVLLRVIETNEIRPVGSSQSRAINCRILASTNADLQELSDENKFRKDLLFRLHRLEISIMPLRERIIDIIPLAEHFLNTGRPQGINATISPELSATLEGYNWPGNVRELRNSIERMRLMNSDKLYYDSNDFDLRTQSDPYFEQTPQIPVLKKAIPLKKHIAKEPTGPQKAEKLMIGKSRIRRLMQLRELFMTHELLTRGEIIQVTNVSPNTATEDLKALCSEGFIEKIQPTASPRSIYFVLNKDK